MELVENPYVSDFTRKTLMQFKWQPDDPIPVTLGEFMLKVKETLPASAKTDVLIDVELMREEDVKAVNDMLDEARAVYKRRTEVGKETENMLPQVREVYEQLFGAEIVDDRTAAVTEAKTEKAPSPAPAQPVSAAAPEPEPVPEFDNRPVILPFCPRCGWDMQQKFEVEITDRDKEDFVVAMLGNLRFKKKYELFGGKMVVTLRALLASENQMIYQQLLADQQANRVITEPEWYKQLIEYRLACSIESVADSKGKLLNKVPELHELPFEAKAPLDTPVASMLDYVDKNVLSQEVFKRIAGTYLRQFQRLVEALEAMAVEPSFWTGIA